MIKTLIKEKLILIRTHFNKSSVLVGVCSIFFMFSLSGSDKTSDITGITCSVTMTAFAAAVCTTSDMHEDKSKFGKYLLAAPADISDISAAKYLFYVPCPYSCGSSCGPVHNRRLPYWGY